MGGYEMLDAHPLSIMIVTSAMLVTPLYLFCVYHYSGASVSKGLALAGIFLVWGSVMTWFSIANIPDALGPAGALVIPICWLVPSLLLFLNQDWVLAEPLSQRWLIGLQVWRLIGGVFLIEMINGNIPGIFAYPAGLGDMLVGVVALIVLLIFRSAAIPRWAVLLVIGLGVFDFLSAFLFGYLSTPGALQLFYPEIDNRVISYPTGLIPLFLVPYCIFFHALSWLSLKRGA